MGALSRFLDRDAAAKAVLLAVLGSAPIPAAAEAIKPAKAPVAAKAAPSAAAKPFQAGVTLPAGEVTEERILLALMDERAKLGKVVGMLRDSTDRCLSEQARLLGAAAEATPETGRATIAKAVDMRAGDLADEMEHDLATAETRALLRSGYLVPAERETLTRHASLRQACLDWSDRSMGFLEDRLAEPRTGAVSSLLAEAKAASARDLERLTRMGPTQDGHGYSTIETMETGAAPRM